MSRVTTYSQLKSELKKVRDKALKEAAKESVDLTKEVINKVVYNAGSPENYQRTYQLRDSFRDNPLESKGDSAVVKLNHDEARISPNVGMFQHASSHWSPWDYSKYIAKTVNDGGSGGLFGDGYWRSARPYIDEAEKELSGGKYKQFMLAQLRGLGYRAR